METSSLPSSALPERSQAQIGSFWDLAIPAIAVFVLGAGAWVTLQFSRLQQSEVPIVVERGTKFRANRNFPPLNASLGAGTDLSSVLLPQPTRTPNADLILGKDSAGYSELNFEALGGFFYEPPLLADKPELLEKYGALTAENNKQHDKSKLTIIDINDQFPDPIKALNGQRVTLRGYMVPFRFKDGMTNSFLFIRDMSLCCFGRVPRLNEWIFVKVKDKRGTPVVKDLVITVRGVLEVGEEIEQGMVASLFRMDADEIVGPLDL